MVSTSTSKKKKAPSTKQSKSAQAKKPKRRFNHVRPEQPLVPAGQKGWWRLKHYLGYLGGISESEYRKGVKVGRYDPPDRYVGRMPQWDASKR